MPEPRPPLAIDAYDGDWIKRGSFDLANHGIDSVEKLIAHLDSIGISIGHFKRLDTYKANVDKLPWLQGL